MGDVMFTIESITDNIVKLENRDTLEVIYEKKDILPKNISEGDIVNKVDGIYIIDNMETNIVKERIRNKFDSLLK